MIEKRNFSVHFRFQSIPLDLYITVETKFKTSISTFPSRDFSLALAGARTRWPKENEKKKKGRKKANRLFASPLPLTFPATKLSIIGYYTLEQRESVSKRGNLKSSTGNFMVRVLKPASASDSFHFSFFFFLSLSLSLPLVFHFPGCHRILGVMWIRSAESS